MELSRPRIKVNGFDFDSDRPVAAHDAQPTLFDQVAPVLIDLLGTGNVILAGAWAIRWICIGGQHKFVLWFMKLAPGWYTLATTGQLGG